MPYPHGQLTRDFAAGVSRSYDTPKSYEVDYVEIERERQLQEIYNEMDKAAYRGKSFTKEVADGLVAVLSSYGYTIQRYNAYGTNSVYLKLDYGLGNSIRISDHKGYGHLKYRYNVRTDQMNVKKSRSHMDEYMRHYYNASAKQIKELVDCIIETRDLKLHGFGIEEYMMQMRERMHANEGRRGFWESAELVHEGSPYVVGQLGELNKGVIHW